MAPNIVLFLTDQLRRDALGCYGNPICKTPNLDKLAEEGIRFDQAYTNSPVCSPARASLMTGMYPHNHGVMINTHIKPAWTRGLSTDSVTFSSLLREAGYELDYAGKWHVHQELGPEEYGFSRHVFERTPNEVVPRTESIIEFPGGNVTAAATSSMPEEANRSWVVADQGISMMRERSKGDKPFFLRIDTTAPHFSNIIPEPYASMYDPASIPPWPNFDEKFEGKPSAHLRKHQEWNLQGKDWDWWSQVVAKYYGDVTLMDTCVGRVLDEIKACGIEDNTIFLFSTDHGDSMGSHKHFEKAGSMYDEVFRIPLLVRFPGSKQSGKVVSQFVRLLDLMPTFVELGGAELSQPVDGRSLVPLLNGENPDDWPDSVYCESHGEVWGYSSQRMVRTENWKYVYTPHDMDELYDLKADPGEMKNLIGDSDCADVLEDMKARLIGWNDETEDMFQWNWVRWNFPQPKSPGSTDN